MKSQNTEKWRIQLFLYAHCEELVFLSMRVKIREEEEGEGGISVICCVVVVICLLLILH